MVKLSHENFIKARDYIFANGDDINRAWFRYLFEGNDTDEFLNVLQKYRSVCKTQAGRLLLQNTCQALPPVDNKKRECYNYNVIIV